jgi:hypothetical protein
MSKLTITQDITLSVQIGREVYHDMKVITLVGIPNNLIENYLELHLKNFIYF